MELTAGLFYGYVVVDVPALVSNLEGCPAEDWTNADRALAGKLVHNLVNLIATVNPRRQAGLHRTLFLRRFDPHRGRGSPAP